MTREGYDGVVYDLDGTLVRLAVDWDQARESAAAVYREAGLDPDGRDLWTLFGVAPDHGLRAAVSNTVAAHERDGARDSERLALADDLATFSGPAGVVSLNAEGAVREALRVHDLAESVRTVVGRDTLSVHKPDPEPLLMAVEDLGLRPGGVVFVGDSKRDAETARRAGVDFEYVDGGPTDH
jgi:phosphoglycolate phosphatase